MPTRMVLGAGLIVGALMVVSLVSYFDNQELYYTVDEVLARPDGPVREVDRLQLRGTVDRGSVDRARDGLELRFRLEGKSGAVPVVYHGIVPDTFDLAEQVTVGGRLGADGTFTADQLFVQCPSKYEAVPPGEQATEGDSSARG